VASNIGHRFKHLEVLLHCEFGNEKVQYRFSPGQVIELTHTMQDRFNCSLFCFRKTLKQCKVTMWKARNLSKFIWETPLPSYRCGRGSESSEAVEVVWCCLVVSLDRLSCSVLFAIHPACLALPSARLIPFRQAPGPLHVVMGARFDT
jgi:hypothetical protein